MAFRWFLNYLERKGRKHTITDRDGKNAYLDRYYVAYPDGTQRQRQDISFNVFLHRFLRSDDPVWHDHPWNFFISIVLKGGYVEHTPWGDKWRGPGHIRFVNCNKLRHIDDDPTKPQIPANVHWVEVPEDGETWTLFIRGRSLPKSWGFFPDKSGVKIHWSEFLKERAKNNDDRNTPNMG